MRPTHKILSYDVIDAETRAITPRRGKAICRRCYEKLRGDKLVVVLSPYKNPSCQKCFECGAET